MTHFFRNFLENATRHYSRHTQRGRLKTSNKEKERALFLDFSFLIIIVIFLFMINLSHDSDHLRSALNVHLHVSLKRFYLIKPETISPLSLRQRRQGTQQHRKKVGKVSLVDELLGQVSCSFIGRLQGLKAAQLLLDQYQKTSKKAFL